VFVTCWSGYGLDQRAPGNQQDLKRHLVCVNRENGEVMWSKTVDAVLPEDPYQGQFTQHGYASHTPASDGQRVYVFFGKTGALAFDMEGNQLWQKGLGTESGMAGWGTASSPILYKDLVIVPATAESQSLVALNKETGEQVWKQEAAGFDGVWGSPILVDTPEGNQELVIGVPNEIWGFDPQTGKLTWYCEGVSSRYVCASVVAKDGVVYGTCGGPGGGGTVAVRVGGKGDVTETHVLWTVRDGSSISTPIIVDGQVLILTNKVATCLDAKTGERVYQTRLGATSDGEASRPQRGGGQGFRGFGGGGGFGGQDYASVVAGDGKLFYVGRSGDVFVLTPGKENLETVAQNRFASDDGEFNASPAISDGQLFVRSTNALYCISGGQ
jgi:outer membrane protein assembly factor BamB